MDRSKPLGGDRWVQDTQKSFDLVAKLRMDFIHQAAGGPAQQRHTRTAAKADKSKRRELIQAGNLFQTAKEALHARFVAEAQLQCQALCSVLYEKLPRELREMVYQYLIEESNAIFYDAPSGKVKLANGRSKNSHSFDADYTGAAVHLEILEELKHQHIRFDFRHQRGMIKDAFNHYQNVHSFDLASVMTTVGIVLNSSDITGRDELATQLSELTRLRKETDIHVFVQADGGNGGQVVRSFRRVMLATLPILTSLCLPDRVVTVVMNPEYALSSVHNRAGSRFSTIPIQDFRYILSPLKAHTCAAQMERELILYSIKHGV